MNEKEWRKLVEKKLKAKEPYLDESFLYTCLNCGGYMNSNGDPYNFWCSEKCRVKGEAFQEKLGEELAEAYKDISAWAEKQSKGKGEKK